MKIIDFIVILVVVLLAAWFLIKGYPDMASQIKNFTP